MVWNAWPAKESSNRIPKEVRKACKNADKTRNSQLVAENLRNRECQQATEDKDFGHFVEFLLLNFNKFYLNLISIDCPNDGL